ncbi:unnamed protein product [Ilex paraguariensis]|uniref:Bromo domain-containing protein n=1 Tax=Ilex paraguariensis TaxID=185542 RepID=A0ABC8RJQ4_9AQUA
MDFRKCVSFGDAPPVSMAPLNFLNKVHLKAQFEEQERAANYTVMEDVDVDLREVYFLIMHFLSAGPCQRTFGLLWNELLEHQLLPRRYHAWYSRGGVLSGDENDDGISFPLDHDNLVERYSHIDKNHLVKLLKQLILSVAPPLRCMGGRNAPSASDVPTLLGTGSFSLLEYSHIDKNHLVKLLKQLILSVAPPLRCMGGRNAPSASDVPTLLGTGSFSLLEWNRKKEKKEVKHLPSYLRWPHMQADQVRGLSFREIGGGFAKHHRAPSIRFACYAVAKPSTMVQKMQNIKRLRGHRDAVYCAIFDRSGRYVITGSDDRLVKIWSMETAFCLASCRGHEGDITDLAISSNNALVASASNDYTIRVWRLPDGCPISILRGHTAAVTAIAFSPRPSSMYQLLSSSDDGTCRIWDARQIQCSPRIYLPKPTDTVAGKTYGSSSSIPSSSNGPQGHQILCCAYNANGTVFVTGSSDTFARVWSACKSSTDDSERPNHEIDVLAGHENDVNYVQFSGCSVASRSSMPDSFTEENFPKFKNSWFSHDNIVTCSRDGSAIIWIPRSRRSHGKVGRWTRSYHLKVPPPPMPPQPPRGGPRQRLLPTPRGVNMIAWSLDNRFVLAAIMDCRICVWNASDGSLVHSLTGHSASLMRKQHTQISSFKRHLIRVEVNCELAASLLGFLDQAFLCLAKRALSLRGVGLIDSSLLQKSSGSLLCYPWQTYVLDVHPFNPRIAMSAGYDGKTIVWDIWEGTPIRIYEIGRFKLVDGRFSPDGTSIVLSDDAGQIYLLNTGQGESQSDAKYDQFFLGDYRPLILDTNGNVLDQETQLIPHRRNIQDPLCDASMLPYPEPYQSMYQRRRLGALGIEWRPSSIKFAIGTDVGLGQEYQILPLADLDIVIDPLPEFLDAMYWEPENDVINDDTDSEYNVPEEYSSEDEQGSSNDSSSSDPEHSEGGNEQSQKDGIRRSKRKKPRAEVESMTSSGRRVKRRTLDDDDHTTSRARRTKKSRSGLNSSKRKSSKVKSLRPQRVAARNAINFFSQITEGSTDGEDEDCSEEDFSESELLLQNSNIRANGPNDDLQNVVEKYSKGEQATLDESENVVKPPNDIESQANVGNRKRLVLKLSLRNSKKSVPSENIRTLSDNQVDIASSSSRPNEEDLIFSRAGDLGSSSNAIDLEPSEDYNQTKFRDNENLKKDEDQLQVSAGYKDSQIRWGEVKARTSKRMKSEDLMPFGSCSGFNGTFDGHNGSMIRINEHVKPENENGKSTPGSGIQDHGVQLLSEACRDEEQCGTAVLEDMDGARNSVCYSLEDAPKSSLYDLSPLDRYQPEGSTFGVSFDKNLTKEGKDFSGSDVSRNHESVVGTNDSPVPKENPPPKPTILRFKSNKIFRDSKSPSELKSLSVVDAPINAGGDVLSKSPSYTKRNPVSGVQAYESLDGPSSTQKLQADWNMNLDDAVRRATSHRLRASLEGYSGEIGEGTSKASSQNHEAEVEFPEAATEAMHSTRSLRLKASSRETDVSHNLMAREGNILDTVWSSKSADKLSKKEFDQLSSEEWIRTSEMVVRSRSTRHSGDSYYDNGRNASVGRKSHVELRKSNWLLLSGQEEGYRYIPQLGDEVVYLRQGHQEYIVKSSCSKEVGPWKKFGESIRAVEICLVEGLDYATLPGSGESCCKITLKFIDSSSKVFGHKFKLTLPELINFSDFIVERTRYDAAIVKNWTCRDKCLVWWRDESEEGGSWWEGRIFASKDKSDEFPGSPWERYGIRYKSDPNASHEHSPWELHDPDSRWVHPHIDHEMRNKMLSSFTKLRRLASRNQDNLGILKLEQVAQKLDFLNRFPVPLSPGIIESRLENDYYRSLEAIGHDIMVMISNAQAYFAKNAEFLTKMRHLSDYFTRTLSKL